MTGGEEQGAGPADAPVRVVELAVPNHMLSEQLSGSGIHVASCAVVFRQMLPSPEAATLQGVTSHGLILTFQRDEDHSPRGLLVPWAQISYVKLHEID